MDEASRDGWRPDVILLDINTPLAVAYVPKPFDLDALVDTVRTHQRAA